MELGAFSVSLTVRDIAASRDFYARLGFEPVAGNVDENWLILRNGATVIGLFQGMFEHNILTFNPGWDQNNNEINPFTDIREIQQGLKEGGIGIENEIDAATQGPASFMITDPDGNRILFDQHR